jgi:hypothetical protein
MINYGISETNSNPSLNLRIISKLHGDQVTWSRFTFDPGGGGRLVLGGFGPLVARPYSVGPCTCNFTLSAIDSFQFVTKKEEEERCGKNAISRIFNLHIYV